MHGGMAAKPKENYSRLQQEHLKEIANAKDRMQQWQQFRTDYEALQARLHTLPDKLTHDVMVPFGKFAYMPGRLYHSNEVLVLLGDNWFAKRSAQQAIDIAERRKVYVVKRLEDEKKQLLNLEARCTFVTDIDVSLQAHKDVVEIKEEYDPVKEEEWRKARKQRKHKEGNSDVQTDSELWARLEQLEEEEEEWLKEEERRCDTAESKLAPPLPKEPEPTPLRDPFSPASPPPAPFHIPICHTYGIRAEDHASSVSSSVPSNVEVQQHAMEASARFTSPADIFRQFCEPNIANVDADEENNNGGNISQISLQPRTSGMPGRQDSQLHTPKAVHWEAQLEHHKTGERHQGNDIPRQQVQREPPAAIPFSGLVVERNTPSISTQQQITQRKISKFKANQQAK